MTELSHVVLLVLSLAVASKSEGSNLNASTPPPKCTNGECLRDLDTTSLMQTAMHKTLWKSSVAEKEEPLKVLVVSFNHGESDVDVSDEKEYHSATRAKVATIIKQGMTFIKGGKKIRMQPDVIVMANQECQFKPLKECILKDRAKGSKDCEALANQYTFVGKAKIDGRTKLTFNKVKTQVEVAVKNGLKWKIVGEDTEGLYWDKGTKGIASLALTVSGIPFRLGSVHLDTSGFVKDIGKIGKRMKDWDDERIKTKWVDPVNIIAGDYNTRMNPPNGKDSCAAEAAVKKQFLWRGGKADKETNEKTQQEFKANNRITEVNGQWKSGYAGSGKVTIPAPAIAKDQNGDWYVLPTYKFKLKFAEQTKCGAECFRSMAGAECKMKMKGDKAVMSLGWLDYYAVVQKPQSVKKFNVQAAGSLRFHRIQYSDHALVSGWVVVSKTR